MVKRRGRSWMVGVCIAVLAAAGCGEPTRAVRIGTGAEGGTNHSLGRGLAEVVSEKIEGVAAETVVTRGSIENMRRLESGEIDFAIVQNDTVGSPDVRAVAVLYKELLHIVVRGDQEIRDVMELRGRVLAIGPEGSGTADVAGRLLDHLGLSEEISPRRHLATGAIERALEGGEIDAAFVLAAIPCPALQGLVSTGRGRLLGLGGIGESGSRLDGLRASEPYLARGVIPAATYGVAPDVPVGTLGVMAVLVTRSAVDDAVVREIARALFANRVALGEHHVVASQLNEEFDGGQLHFPLHVGAIDYYARNEPSFFVEYAEAMSFAFSILLFTGSGILALRQWLRRRKKDRIDAYYVEIAELTDEIDSASRENLAGIRAQLLELRRRAFRELVSERLEANESFTIFQDYLRTELSEIEEHLSRPPV